MNTVANTAFSLTLSGNSGISPFLTMAIIGVAGKIFPDNLPLEPTSTYSSDLFLLVYALLSLFVCVRRSPHSLYASHLTLIGNTISFHHFTLNFNIYINNSGKDHGIMARHHCLVFSRDT